MWEKKKMKDTVKGLPTTVEEKIMPETVLKCTWTRLEQYLKKCIWCCIEAQSAPTKAASSVKCSMNELMRKVSQWNVVFQF